MAWYNFGKKEEIKVNEIKVDSDKFMAFSTPFLKIGKGDLTKPNIDISRTGVNGYVRFGADNLYPQILNQMYYTSPLHGSIIEYKKNALIGGGYMMSEIVEAKKKVELYTFIKKNKFNKIYKLMTRDLIIHNRVCVVLSLGEDGRPFKFVRVSPEKVRVNGDKTSGYICEDWLRQGKIEEIPMYKESGNVGVKRCLYLYELETPGQDFYPVPMYTSALNWMQLDGQLSVLNKTFIDESIFPSMIIRRPQKFNNPEEVETFKEGLTRKKGPTEGVNVIVLSADGKDMLPEITFPTHSTNENMFGGANNILNENICKAHQMDQLLVGIRVAGKLGSSDELKTNYVIFEKNYILPLREELEYLFNDILDIFNIDVTLTINDYQIIDGEIVDKTEEIDEDDKEKLI